MISIKRSRIAFVGYAVATAVAYCSPLVKATAPDTRVMTAFVPPAPERIVRELTSSELAASQLAVFALNLRNRDELSARVARGEVVSPTEMASRYYPTRDTWTAVANWARSQGLSVDEEDCTHMSVAAHGQIAQVALSLQTHFAIVKGTDGKEYTSAVTAPLLPTTLAKTVSGVLRLQEQCRLHPAAVYPDLSPGKNFLGPQYLLDTYNAAGVGDGTGQTVAIFGFNCPPNANDLTTYWAKIGSPHTMADVTIVNPSNYPAFDDATQPSAGSEVTMDTEIITGLCAGVKVRIYCIDDLGQAAQAVLADLAQYPQMHVFSISGTSVETAEFSGTFTSYSQYYLALAAQGVTTVAASGDSGSNPSTSGNSELYAAGSPIATCYPASDPNVTGIGATAQIFSVNNDPSGSLTDSISGVQAEVAWTEGVTPAFLYAGHSYSGGGSGGGISSVFARPSWQTGNGVPEGTMRCVPDISAVGWANGGLYTYVGGDSAAGGTSESAAVWASFAAMLNQSLQAAGHGPLGLLAARLYLWPERKR